MSLNIGWGLQRSVLHQQSSALHSTFFSGLSSDGSCLSECFHLAAMPCPWRGRTGDTCRSNSNVAASRRASNQQLTGLILSHVRLVSFQPTAEGSILSEIREAVGLACGHESLSPEA
eukprot:632366-Prymnesium_polylepis.1